MAIDATGLVDGEFYWIVFVGAGDEVKLELASYEANVKCFLLAGPWYWVKLKNVLQVVSKLERPAMPEQFQRPVAEAV